MTGRTRPGGVVDGYLRAVRALSRASGVLAAGLIAFGVLVICDMVIERYLLGRDTVWQIDVVTYCVVAATFIGSAYVLMTRGHVNVDVPIGLPASGRSKTSHPTGPRRSTSRVSYAISCAALRATGVPATGRAPAADRARARRARSC